MASLHMAQIIGTKEENKIVWSNSSSIAKYFIIQIDNNKLKINTRQDEVNDSQTCQIVYASIQGVPGTQITVNKNSFRIGRTGIIEFDVYKHKMIDDIQIDINNLYQIQDKNYYSYNNKCIVDIVYEIGFDLAKAFTNTKPEEEKYNG